VKQNKKKRRASNGKIEISEGRVRNQDRKRKKCRTSEGQRRMEEEQERARSRPNGEWKEASSFSSFYCQLHKRCSLCNPFP